MENNCVCCGRIIPEGRSVCPDCEAGTPYTTTTRHQQILKMDIEQFAEFLLGIETIGFMEKKLTSYSDRLKWLQQEVKIHE